jgi:hypothetical protein
MTVAERMTAALNAHDLDAFVDCFAPGYDSEQPAHPDRSFRSREQVRANWSTVFAGVPDFRADIVRVDEAGDVEWIEWHWHGTGLDMAGVTVFGVRDGRVAWARLYMEPVEQAGAGIEAAVRDMAGDDAG